MIISSFNYIFISMSTGMCELLHCCYKEKKRIKYFHKFVHPVPLFYVIYGVEAKVFQKYRIFTVIVNFL